MNRRRPVLALAILAALGLGLGLTVAPESAATAVPVARTAPPPPDQFTVVVAATLDSGQSPVLGTDGKLHVVYELQLTNAKADLATLQEIQVLDADHPSRVVATFAGADLLHRLRKLTAKEPAGSLDIPEDVSRLVLVDLTFAADAQVPRQLIHRFRLLGQPVTGGPPAQLDYTAAPFDLAGKPLVIGPPLAGPGWVDINGCCGSDTIHRNTVLPVNGRLADTQRFAIDYMRLDAQGRFVHGDPADVRNYTDYGAQLIAVADGRVVSTLSNLDDQVPGTLPDPSTITLENVDGNHVVLDLGHGVFAFYAHMQRNSVTVKVGDRVRRGQVLGLLGNTGNTSAPHLHFHLMDGPSVLGSSGLPYTYDRFSVAGSIDAAQFAASDSLEGVWNQGLLPTPSPRSRQFPLDLTLVDFAG